MKGEDKMIEKDVQRKLENFINTVERLNDISKYFSSNSKSHKEALRILNEKAHDIDMALMGTEKDLKKHVRLNKLKDQLRGDDYD